MAGSTPRQSGMTSPHSKAESCQSGLRSSLGDFHVKISPPQAFKLVWKGSEAGFFSRYSGSLTKSGRASSSLKMSRRLGPVAESEWSKSWPRSGMTVDGIVWPLQMWHRRISVTGGSYLPTHTESGQPLLPTPTAARYGTGGNGIRKGTQRQVVSLDTMASKDLWPNSRVEYSPIPCTVTSTGIGMWPTPTSTDAKSSGRHTTTTGIMHPGTTLTDAARAAGEIFPTPTSRDHRSGVTATEESYSRQGGAPLNEHVLKKDPWPLPPGEFQKKPRVLNPTFVCWLMNFPAGWTELDTMGWNAWLAAKKAVRKIKKS